LSALVRGEAKVEQVSLGELIASRLDDHRPCLVFEGRTWTWAHYARACVDRANYLLARRVDGPFHVGVLLDNVPDFVMLLGAAALSGAVIVGLNPTRRGAELAHDVAHTDCQLIVTEGRHKALLSEVGEIVPAARVVDIDAAAWQTDLALTAGAAVPEVALGPDDLFMLIFTSGTSGNPKAVRCTHAKITTPGVAVVGHLQLTPDDRAYLSMPLFHSACVMAGWSPTIVSGASMALRRKFSASAFLDDVRQYGCTWFNYVGKPLAYVLATPERPDDADNPLRVAMGNESTHADVARFSARFAVHVFDGYGATESGLNILRTPETPPNAMGPLPEGVAVLHQETGEPAEIARFDASGRLLNGPEAIGEMVNTLGAGAFLGYYGDPDAERERLRGGMYRSGDLAYVDAQGFAYFAGRTSDWLRVDGENLATAPIERLILRHPDVEQVAVYGVPNAEAGDDVMACVVLAAGASFDPEAFTSFLEAQPDLGTKWPPLYVRVTVALPLTQTNKVLKRVLVQERWRTGDALWWRPGRTMSYRPMAAADAEGVEAALIARGRAASPV
jgi:fatty-acyl-CoA synthase